MDIHRLNHPNVRVATRLVYHLRSRLADHLANLQDSRLVGHRDSQPCILVVNLVAGHLVSLSRDLQCNHLEILHVNRRCCHQLNHQRNHQVSRRIVRWCDHRASHRVNHTVNHLASHQNGHQFNLLIGRQNSHYVDQHVNQV